MWAWLEGWLRKRQRRVSQPLPYQFLISEACLEGAMACLSFSIASCYEGIVYLLGRTDGSTTIAVAAIGPPARTTKGSFEVGPIAMAKVVRAAADHSLQVVGQLHTHPSEAYHSEGDVAGSRIRYTGYVSVVLPCYGRLLPELRGAAFYFYDTERRFVELDSASVIVLPGRIE